MKEKPKTAEPCELLANAIIVQAVDDYREAWKKLGRTRSEKQKIRYRKQICEIESFFLSDWFKTLTSINGGELKDALLAEVRMEGGGLKRISSEK